MPQTIYLPRQQNWWDPMMKQGSNFLWQLAMAKAQNKMALDRIDTEARYNAALKEKEHEYRMEEKGVGPQKPVAGKKYYHIFDPTTGSMKRTEVETPLKTSKAFITWKTPEGDIVNLQSGVAPPTGSTKYSEPTVQFIGTDAQGKPLVMNTKGKPNIRSAGGPAGIGPKTTQRLSGEQQKSLSDLASISKSIKSVSESYKDSFVGPVDARIRKYGSKFMEMPEYKTFENQVGQLRAIVYGLSGKQINEAELRWLKEEILPQLTSPGANFMATLKVLDEWVIQKYGGTRTAFKDQGFITGGPEELIPYTPQQKPGVPQQTGKPPLDSFWK
jgi:hypothetical protein